MDNVQDIEGAPDITVYFSFTTNHISFAELLQAPAACCLCKPKVIVTHKTHPGQTHYVAPLLVSLYSYIYKKMAVVLSREKQLPEYMTAADAHKEGRLQRRKFVF